MLSLAFLTMEAARTLFDPKANQQNSPEFTFIRDAIDKVEKALDDIGLEIVRETRAQPEGRTWTLQETVEYNLFPGRFHTLLTKVSRPLFFQ